MDDNKKINDYINRVLLLRKRKSKKKVLPISKVNLSLQKNYGDILKSLASQVESIVKLSLYPTIDDLDENSPAPAEAINRVFDSIQLRASKAVGSTLVSADKVIERMNDHNHTKFVQSMKQALGIEISDVITSPEIQKQLQIITEENFNLIKSIPQEELSRIKTIVLNNLSQGRFESGELKELLTPIFARNKKRAEFIAKDQSHKINASLNKIRNQSVGITQYKWRNSNDLRVRGNPAGYYPRSQYNHWTREGKIYDYDDTQNPPDGQPGMPIRCRCYAEAVIPEIYQQ